MKETPMEGYLDIPTEIWARADCSAEERAALRPLAEHFATLAQRVIDQGLFAVDSAGDSQGDAYTARLLTLVVDGDEAKLADAALAGLAESAATGRELLAMVIAAKASAAIARGLSPAITRLVLASCLGVEFMEHPAGS
jgi:flagellar motor component MotA